jgi:hypothetical protein
MKSACRCIDCLINFRLRRKPHGERRVLREQKNTVFSCHLAHPGPEAERQSHRGIPWFLPDLAPRRCGRLNEGAAPMAKKLKKVRFCQGASGGRPRSPAKPPLFSVVLPGDRGDRAVGGAGRFGAGGAFRVGAAAYDGGGGSCEILRLFVGCWTGCLVKPARNWRKRLGFVGVGWF